MLELTKIGTVMSSTREKLEWTHSDKMTPDAKTSAATTVPLALVSVKLAEKPY